MQIGSIEDLLAGTPGPALFEAACEWLAAHPDHSDAVDVHACLAEWSPADRTVHDARGWNLAIEPQAWSGLIHGLVCFDWGPWPEAYAQLAVAEHLTGLRRLEIHTGQLTDAAAVALGASAFLPHIETLVLPSVGLTANGATALAEGLGAVHTLDVSANPLTDAGLTPLISAVAPSLECLNADQIDAQTLDGLINPALPRLREVRLSANILSPDAVEQLSRASFLSSLEYLDLSLSLHSPEHLRRLITGNLEGSAVTLKVNHPPVGDTDTVRACLQSTHAGLQQIGLDTLEYMSKSALKAVGASIGLKGSSRTTKTQWLALILAAVRPG